MELLVPVSAFLALLVILDGIRQFVEYVRGRRVIRRRLREFVSRH